jgi:trehalose-6-phosphate synthase
MAIPSAQDYQLMLLLQMIKEQRSLDISIGFFLHIPFLLMRFF